MHRVEFLNRLVEVFAYRTYLEIGVDRGACLEAIRAHVRVGVDPQPAIRELRIAGAMLFCGMSDDFFRSFHAPGFFDLVFIDGWHEHEQVYRDVTNSLQMLRTDGTIVLHDCNPTTEAMQHVPQIQGEWTGDCWKAIVRLRTTRNDLAVSVLDTDYGLGIVRRRASVPFACSKSWKELTWNDLARDREQLLGLVPLSQCDQFFTR